MERLTKYLASGAAAYDYPADCYSGDNGNDRVAKSAYRQTCVDRLAAYEDTGLTPEELSEMQCEWVVLRTIAEEYGGFDRARELARADREGRVVVLPCKVGDTVYVNGEKRTVQATIDEAYLDDVSRIKYIVSFACDKNCDGCPFNSWRQDHEGEYSCEGEWEQSLIMGSDFGKTVFLTREEAEEALGRTENG